jgi:two-component system NtrC family sensor kinase
METPFIVVVVKQKAEMMKVWTELRTDINWFVGFSVVAIIFVITIVSTFFVNKLYLTDKAKAETMVLMEQNNQLASIGRLAAGVAHEINNPLALINETAGYIKDLFSFKEEYKDDHRSLWKTSMKFWKRWSVAAPSRNSCWVLRENST